MSTSTLKKVAAALAVVLPLGASAAVQFTTGNVGTGLTDNVVFNPCASITTTGLTVSGCLNTAHTTYVDFTGSENLQVNGGQARIEAVDGSFNNLLIQMQNPLLGFTRIIFNINTDPLDPTGSIGITANLFSPGSALSYSQNFSLGNGENFFTVTSDNNDVIKSLYFTSNAQINSVEFEDTRQVRLGLAQAPTVTGQCLPPLTGTFPNCITPSSEIPEPGTLALLGMAFAGAGWARRRRPAA